MSNFRKNESLSLGAHLTNKGSRSFSVTLCSGFLFKLPGMAALARVRLGIIFVTVIAGAESDGNNDKYQNHH